MSVAAAELARIVKAIRDAKSLSREKFARIVDISAATITSLERQKRNPSPALAMKLADMAESLPDRLTLLEHAGITKGRVEAWFGEIAAGTPAEEWAQMAVATLFERAPEEIKAGLLDFLEERIGRYGLPASPKGLLPTYPSEREARNGVGVKKRR